LTITKGAEATGTFDPVTVAIIYTLSAIEIEFSIVDMKSIYAFMCIDKRKITKPMDEKWLGSCKILARGGVVVNQF
jgi:hypothetical protein